MTCPISDFPPAGVSEPHVVGRLGRRSRGRHSTLGPTPLGESPRWGRTAVSAHVAPCRFDVSTEPP
jgi:hypothetical protein